MTLDELVALNDEIAALVRAGVPLEAALAQLGGDLPGRLRKCAARLAERTARGEPLAEAMTAEAGQFPPVYRAVVEAGVRSGRLSAALESVAGPARRLAEARRMVAAGIIYPVMVLLVAWGAFILFTVKVSGSLLAMFKDFHIPGQSLMATLVRWGDSAAWWGPAVPLAVVVLAGVWWFYSARAGLVEPRAAGWFLGWLPWTGRMLRQSRVASFADVLALLVESRVPLPESIVLAAETVGGARLVASARQIADALRRGEPLAGTQLKDTGLPPLAAWLLIAGERRGALLPALHHTAETYHQRARYLAEKARVFLPVLLTVVIGGGAVAVYAALVFGSWITILRTLAVG
jgi:type II secretory pathway component PulF